MIERLIENWLNSTTERGYEQAFRQSLCLRGHKILHQDPHSQLEEGKDLLTVDQNGTLCGYQLKSGNISVARWRNEVRDEIIELVEYPVRHPAHKGSHCKPYLVTTGTLTPTAIERFNQQNDSFASRGLAQVELLQHGDLFAQFLETHGRFLPTEPPDFASLLRLFQHDGFSNPNQDEIYSFARSLLRNATSANQLRQAASSACLFGAYITLNHVLHENNYSIAVTWITIAAAILSEAIDSEYNSSIVEDAISSCKAGATTALSSLSGEVFDRTKNIDNPDYSWFELAEGRPVWDAGPPYAARLLLLCSALAVQDLISCDDSDSILSTQRTKAVGDLIRHLLPKSFCYGESAIPHYAIIIIFLEHYDALLAHSWLCSISEHLVSSFSKDGEASAMPNLYATVDECVAAACETREIDRMFELVKGWSYCVHPMIDMHLRRNNIQWLKTHWYEITGCSTTTVSFDTPAAYLTMTDDRIQITSRFFPRPTSLEWLRESERYLSTDEIPGPLQEDPSLALLFVFCFPHRFSRPMAQLLDRSFGATW